MKRGLAIQLRAHKLYEGEHKAKTEKVMNQISKSVFREGSKFKVLDEIARIHSEAGQVYDDLFESLTSFVE
jgi:hypothetical protein